MQNNPVPTPPPAEQPAPPVAAPPRSNGRSRTIVFVTIFFLLCGLAWFLYWFLYLQFEEYTDDAYANGNLVTINSAISGSVVAFYADNTDLVKEGQLLVLLDKTEYQVLYEKELAALASTVLQVRQLYDTVSTKQANVQNKRILQSKAKYDYDNRQGLVGSKAVSNEDFIHARDSLRTAELDLKQAEAELQVALDAAGITMIENHPTIEQQSANVRIAYYNLRHCAIYAPTTGYVAQRVVDVGQWVTPTTPLMAVIPIDYMWVDANFKETQLSKMRIGQPAKVWFDIYGSSVEYQGKVLGIASGTGSVFSIIPPQNATGNWIKIVQRLPVRISLDPDTAKKYPPRLGISAEVEVDITNTDLPFLAENPPTKPVATTRVFDLSFKKVDEIIDKIIKENLEKRPS